MKGILVESSVILDVFENDWNSVVKSPEVKTDFLKIAAVGVVLVILILLYYHRQKV